MTTTNHALAGAIIAVAVRQPVLAVVLAFISHFLMDALPHFGIQIENNDVRTRNDRPLFKWVTTRIDVAGTIIAVVLLPILLRPRIAWPLTLACILAAIAPDLIWVYRFIRELKTGKLGRKSVFSKFHKWIQWGEYPWALVFDICWFVGCLILVSRFV